MGPGDLHNLMKGVNYKKSSKVLVGMDDSDDCGVIEINDLKILQTVDIITPVVNEPYIFGQIAVVNSLSDIYAMGGTPLSVLNIACFPVDCLPIVVLQEILEGGKSKIDEAQVDVLGGHTITDKEIKYGLSVTGLAGEKIFINKGAKPDLDIILTKPIGGGVVSTALKGELISDEHKKKMIECMTRLNKYALESLDFMDVYAMTDVTGFGLLGHLFEIARASNISIDIDYNNIPFMDGFFDYLNYGLIPAGSYRNRDYVNEHVAGDADKILILSTPETSGGLLIFCNKDKTKELLMRLIDRGDRAVIIGETGEKSEKYIKIV
ncbi:MAG: selenide, water dikinase SelD [Proteobacteria bacterium]|nr:selenide, water dikinase SelD [Pseudomonadota bacterium]